REISRLPTMIWHSFDRGLLGHDNWCCGRGLCAAARIILCVLAFCAAQPASAIEPKREPKRVLLLHASSGANLLYATKIRAELERQSPEPLEGYDASFLTGR